jgi:sec-independent protein translocase protein TatA
MGSIGVPELIVIFLIIVLLFGAKRIPELARGLGKGIREFKDATKEGAGESKPTETKDKSQEDHP